MPLQIGSSQSAHVEAMAIQPDGKIVVVGYSVVGNTDFFTVVRYNVDGSLDTESFGQSAGNGQYTGYVTNTVGSGSSEATGVAIQPDGKIVVVGYAGVQYVGNEVAIVRYNVDGSLDTESFGQSAGNGQYTGYVLGPTIGQWNSVAINQSSGEIVAAGASNAGYAIGLYSSAGVLQNTIVNKVETGVHWNQWLSTRAAGR